MGFWEKKNTVSKSFFRLTLPKGWAETSVDAGVRFQDETGSRSLLLREIVYPPTPGAEAASVLAFVTNEYRESLDHVLPSPHHLDDVKVRDAKGLLRMAFAASREEAGVTRCFFVGTTARATVDGGFRLIAAYYEDFTATTLDARPTKCPSTQSARRGATFRSPWMKGAWCCFEARRSTTSPVRAFGSTIPTRKGRERAPMAVSTFSPLV